MHNNIIIFFRMAHQELHKMYNQINNLDSDVRILQDRNQRSPLISLSGLRNLELYKTARHCDKELNTQSLIYMLFKLLKIPRDWILQIGQPPQVYEKSSHVVPFEAYIYLTHDSIKFTVYRMLLKHIRKTKQKTVHVKIINF
jgi:hypothetical protein